MYMEPFNESSDVLQIALLYVAVYFLLPSTGPDVRTAEHSF